METDSSIRSQTTREAAVAIRDAAKAKYDAADVLLTDLVPPRMSENKEFMAFIAGILFSDLNDHHIYLLNCVPANSHLKLICEVFDKTIFQPYVKHYNTIKATYIRAQNALNELERLEAYIAENST